MINLVQDKKCKFDVITTELAEFRSVEVNGKRGGIVYSTKKVIVPTYLIIVVTT